MDELTTLIDLDAERGVIGSLCIDDAHLPAVRAIIAPEDFTDPRCRHFYRAMLAMADRGVPVDAWTLRWELEALGFMEDAKPSHIAWCASITPTSAHAVHYAQRVHDMAERRRMFSEAQRIAGAALDRTKPVVKGTKGGVAQV